MLWDFLENLVGRLDSPLVLLMIVEALSLVREVVSEAVRDT